MTVVEELRAFREVVGDPDRIVINKWNLFETYEGERIGQALKLARPYRACLTGHLMEEPLSGRADRAVMEALNSFQASEDIFLSPTEATGRGAEFLASVVDRAIQAQQELVDVDCGCQRYCADLDPEDDHPRASCRGLPPLSELEEDESS